MDMSLILEFVQEAREYIEEIEPTLIEINNGSESAAGAVDSELINSVFRLFHSMKGGAGFLALATVVSVTHEAETLLDKIRNGKLSLTVQITATLCKALDLFREMLDHIADTGNDEGFTAPASAIIKVLKKHVAGEPVGENELVNLLNEVGGNIPDAMNEVNSTTPIPAPLPTQKNNSESNDGLSFDALKDEPPKTPVPISDLQFNAVDEINVVANSVAAPTSAAATASVSADVSSAPSASGSLQQFPNNENAATELTNLQLSPEMRHGFVAEATEQLDAAEQALLLVQDETNADPTEPLKDLFRYIHSFKGNCGFMGLVDLEHLSHTMETLLDNLRSGTIKPDANIVGKLLGMVDVLREATKDIEEGGSAQVKDLQSHIQTINTLMNLTPVTQPAPTPTPPTSNATTSTTPTSTTSTSPTPPPATSMTSTPSTTSSGSGAVDVKVSAAKVSPLAPQLQLSDVLPATDKGAAQHPTATATAATSGTTSGGGGSSKAKQDIRVDLHKLDILINLVGELVIAESMVTRCPAVAHVEDEYYNRAKHQLRRICDDLQDVAMSVRMIPLSATFRKMIRLVHDLATKTGKRIKLNLVGEDTEVDKTVIEQIADPLVHIVRNSCDHGVELPDERVKAGKSDTGTVTLEGRHEGGEVWIIIKDDGRGLNKEKIIAKAIEKGLVGNEVRDWPEDRIFKLIFEPGFSTADKVTDVSGRGVGMDVVKRNIEKLNGRIDISSKYGEGSIFTLRIPLTLAIVDAMLVRVGDGRYMIPTLTIRESLVPTMKQVTITPEGREILRLREEMVPIIRLYDVFGCKPGAERLRDGILIVAEDGGRSFAFFVDEIIGQQQTVIKGLPDYIGEANGFSGCTILGDGTVSLIVDVGAVSQMTGSFAASPVNKYEVWEDTKNINAHHVDTTFTDLESVVEMA
ncbi:MAG: chemotaxis protein CheA [Planctomycetaceae bacterium]|jgi:two-component system chemotaxis sensor kinase CheA|nr:chemotaxis protein CheA [Planctomycetaceae bacterium]